MLWEDINYANEKTHPLPGKTRSDDVNKFDKELFSYYQKLTKLRRDNQALSSGTFDILDVAVTENTFGFIRSTENQRISVLFNRASAGENIELISDKKLKDIFSGKVFESNNGRVRINLKPQSFVVLE